MDGSVRLLQNGSTFCIVPPDVRRTRRSISVFIVASVHSGSRKFLRAATTSNNTLKQLFLNSTSRPFSKESKHEFKIIKENTVGNVMLKVTNKNIMGLLPNFGSNINRI